MVSRGLFSGGRGIRTPATLAGRPVFKTGAISRSAIPPGCYYILSGLKLGHFLKCVKMSCAGLSTAAIARCRHPAAVGEFIGREDVSQCPLSGRTFSEQLQPGGAEIMWQVRGNQGGLR